MPSAVAETTLSLPKCSPPQFAVDWDSGDIALTCDKEPRASIYWGAGADTVEVSLVPPLGLSIAGTKGVFVTRIKDGSGKVSGVVEVGMKLLSIDGQDVATKDKQAVVSVIKTLTGATTFILAVPRRDSLKVTKTPSTKTSGEEIVLQNTPETKMGFGLMKDPNGGGRGAAVKSVAAGGQAEATGKIFVGQVVTHVNGTDITTMKMKDLVPVIKSASTVVFRFGPAPLDEATSADLIEDSQIPSKNDALSTTKPPHVVYDVEHTTYTARSYATGKLPSDTVKLVINRCSEAIWSTVDPETGKVKLTCNQKGAQIYWNAAGENPSPKDAHQLYNEESNCPNTNDDASGITSGELRAQAFCIAMTPSIITTKTLSLAKCPPPRFSVNWDSGAIALESSSAEMRTPAVRIYWTADNQTPDENDNQSTVTPPHLVYDVDTTTYKARAYAAGMSPSDTVDLVVNRCSDAIWSTVDSITGKLKLTCNQTGAKLDDATAVAEKANTALANGQAGIFNMHNHRIKMVDPLITTGKDKLAALQGRWNLTGTDTNGDTVDGSTMTIVNRNGIQFDVNNPDKEYGDGGLVIGATSINFGAWIAVTLTAKEVIWTNEGNTVVWTRDVSFKALKSAKDWACSICNFTSDTFTPEVRWQWICCDGCSWTACDSCITAHGKMLSAAKVVADANVERWRPQIYWNSDTDPNTKDPKQLYNEETNCPNSSQSKLGEFRAQALFTEMTPSIITCKGLSACQEPVFGTFDWKAAKLEIRDPPDGTIIRWTKNEAEVPESSTVYDGSIAVDRSAGQIVYKARAFKPGWQPPKVVTKTIDTCATPTIIPTATDTAIEFKIEQTKSPAGTLAISTDGSVPHPGNAKVAPNVQLNSVAQRSLMVRAYKDDTTETGFFPSSIAKFTSNVKQAQAPVFTPTTSEELAKASFRVCIGAPTKESSIMFGTKKPDKAYDDNDRPKLLLDNPSGATIYAQAVSFSALKFQAQKQVEKAAGKVRRYMEGKEIMFGTQGHWDDPGFSYWNIDDFAPNREILDGIAKIMNDNPLASLKLAGFQFGGYDGEADPQKIVAVRESKKDFPGITLLPAAAAHGRVLACKKVLVGMGINESRLTATAEISDYRAVRFIPDLGVLEAHDDAQASDAVTSTMQDGAESISVSEQTCVYWKSSTIEKVTYKALQCAAPTFKDIFINTSSGNPVRSGNVAIASVTSGASIYYTAASAAPTTQYDDSVKPTFDFLRAEDQLFRAVARREGYMESKISVHNYTAPVMPDPTVVRGGPSKTQVLMECTESDAIIKFKVEREFFGVAIDLSDTIDRMNESLLNTVEQEYDSGQPYVLPTEKAATVKVAVQSTRPGAIPSNWVIAEFDVQQVNAPSVEEMFTIEGRDVTMKCGTQDD